MVKKGTVLFWKNTQTSYVMDLLDNTGEKSPHDER